MGHLRAVDQAASSGSAAAATAAASSAPRIAGSAIVDAATPIRKDYAGRSLRVAGIGAAPATVRS